MTYVCLQNKLPSSSTESVCIGVYSDLYKARSRIIYAILKHNIDDLENYYNPQKRFIIDDNKEVIDRWIDSSILPEYTIEIWSPYGELEKRLYCTFDFMFKDYIIENNVDQSGIISLLEAWKQHPKEDIDVLLLCFDTDRLIWKKQSDHSQWILQHGYSEVNPYSM